MRDSKVKRSGARTFLRRVTGEKPKGFSGAIARYGALLGFIGVNVAFAFAHSRLVVKPIRELLSGISRVMEGDYETPVDMPPVGPARKPIREFNEMLAVLSRVENDRENYFANVSHEFKTPLSYIQQFATLLQDDTLSDEDRKEYLEGIVAGTHRLSNMVSSMLELAIAGNADGSLGKEAYSLDEQLRQAVILFAPIMDQKEISYDADLAEVTICANECLLGEVWANIMSNAVKYTGSGGSIHVKLREESYCAQVAITDTGIGMSQEEIDRAFERFYRKEGLDQEGTGLGLPIVKTIVDRHGGTVRLDSSPGTGTICTVVLPLRSSSAGEPK